MSVIDDGAKAIQASRVDAVIKWQDGELAWMTLTLHSGEAVVLRFETSGERDDFYKRLVEAMGSL